MSLKAKLRTPEQIEKAASPHRGMKRSEETRRKIAESKRNLSEETRRKMSEAARKRSAETTRKIAESRILNNRLRDAVGIPRKTQTAEHVKKRIQSSMQTKKRNRNDSRASRSI